MSRSDWITSGVTIVATGVAYFIAGPRTALLCIFVGVVFVLIAHVRKGKDPKTAPEDQITGAKGNFNPTVTQIANPTINVNLGHSTPAAAPPAETEKIEPNIRFLGARVAYLDCDSYQGVSFNVRSAASTPNLGGVIACFRNEAIYGKTIKPVYRARAHLRFFDSSGVEIGTGVSRACWLGHKGDLVDLVPGEAAVCLLVLLRNDRTTAVPWKQRERSWMGDHLIDEYFEFTDVPHVAEVSLLDGNSQLVLPPILLDLASGDGGLRVTARQNP
jgi:hypothetical protein